MISHNYKLIVVLNIFTRVCIFEPTKKIKLPIKKYILKQKIIYIIFFSNFVPKFHSLILRITFQTVILCYRLLKHSPLLTTLTP
jgi:hypothetical protein